EAMQGAATSAWGATVRQTWRHRASDQRILNVEISANDFSLDGKDVRLVLVADVTDRMRAEDALRRTEDQLRHAQKMDAIGLLAGGGAHDFNNVLTVIESYACLLEESFQSTDARQDEAAQIRRAAERGAQITRQ